MKKDFIISKIEASQDGSPYVYVAFSDPINYKPDAEGSFWCEHDGIYFHRGHDEEFAKSHVKYF